LAAVIAIILIVVTIVCLFVLPKRLKKLQKENELKTTTTIEDYTDVPAALRGKKTSLTQSLCFNSLTSHQ
jgi:hypothetical protein